MSPALMRFSTTAEPPARPTPAPRADTRGINGWVDGVTEQVKVDAGEVTVKLDAGDEGEAEAAGGSERGGISAGGVVVGDGNGAQTGGSAAREEFRGGEISVSAGGGMQMQVDRIHGGGILSGRPERGNGFIIAFFLDSENSGLPIPRLRGGKNPIEAGRQAGQNHGKRSLL